MMDQNQCNLYNLESVRFHPFFRGVDPDSALSLLSLCEIRHYEKNEMMLKKDKPREGLLLMIEGLSEVFVGNDSNDREEVLEVIQKGEMIGFSRLADFLGVSKQINSEVMVQVKAVSTVKALYIPFEVVTKRWDDPSVHDYLLTQVAIRLKDIYTSLAEQVKLARDHGENDAIKIRVQDIMSEEVVTVTPVTTVQETARLMHEKRISSVLVMEKENLKGIITERDMVARVVARGLPMTSAAQEIMTPNPLSISRFAYYYDAISMILLKGIKHLPVIEDSKLVGIVTLSDLLRKNSENVIKTIQKIEQADMVSLPMVRCAIYEVNDTLFRDRVPILKTFEIITNLYDRLVLRIVELSIQKLQASGREQPCSFAFYQMGSSGREEQFILTDQDHFLVYEDDSKKANDYFSELGKEITNNMESAGYARCKGLMMCSEPEWRGSLADWEERMRKWMLQSTNDNLLVAQNFFSYRFIAGSNKLHERFERVISNQMERSRIFLFRLAQIEREHPIPSLDQPIRSLFKLERKTIDMKKEVLFPYHHSLQILSLLQGKQSGTPMEKIEWLMNKRAFSDAFAQDLREAVSHILTLYVNQRWHQEKNGSERTSIISFTRLSTREKEELILSLKTLRELQRQVFTHFSLLLS
jgi:CBS domain-containing protein